MDCLVLEYYPSHGPASNPALYCRPLEENHTCDHSTLPQGIIPRMHLGAALVSPPDLMLQLTIAGGFYAYAEVILWVFLCIPPFTRSNGMTKKIQANSYIKSRPFLCTNCIVKKT